MNRTFVFWLFALSTCLANLHAQAPDSQTIKPPVTTTPNANENVPARNDSAMIRYPNTAAESTVDDYFGNKVADPYRWLEDTESEGTAKWIESQNKITNAYLQSLPSRPMFRDKLEAFWNYERYGLPRKYGKHYLYFHNDGLQNQSILYKATSLEGSREVLIDPNTLSEDGTIALSSIEVSDDGQYVAYDLADGGSDWRTWKVRRIDSGQDTDDVIEWVKFSSIAWTSDSSGFFYGRYAAPVDGKELLGTNENQQLYYHKLGTKQSEDKLIFSRPDEPKWGYSALVTEDGRYLVIQNWKGTEPKSQIFLKDLTQDGDVRELIMGFDAEYEFIDSIGSTLYFLTDNDAPKRRVIAVDADNASRDRWKTVIAQSDDVLETVSLLGKTFYASYLKDARSEVRMIGIDSVDRGNLDLPGVGSVAGFAGKQDSDETFFTFENYVTPTSIYRIDLKNEKISPWKQPKVAFDTDDFVTEQIFCTSKDGTRVPVTITRRVDAVKNQQTPTILYGYGGFNISVVPKFSAGVAAWIDARGIYAVATLRGGGEYGREWHESGMRQNKQNVFDDCIAAAEALIETQYTSAETLSLSGRSNGGLLVGAVMTQRPDLFGAVLPAVGVMDMLRYHKFTIGWAWATEFGSSDEADQIENLLSYSPLHNLKPGVCYPATLITTADRDDRVVPGHSFKYAAALQAAQDGDRPTLIRIETRAGHGAGTPVTKLIEEYADTWSFLKENLKPEVSKR
jgi:prolyl oligopeptidase